MSDILIMTIVACGGIVATTYLNITVIRGKQRTIDRQHETIQKLLNREPVTYAEVGASPKPTKDKTVYAAWGNQTVNIDTDGIDLKVR